MEDNNQPKRKKNLNGALDELFDNYKITRDVSVRNQIVQKYLYLAEIISKKFLNRGMDYEDIYQVASIALIKAVERYDDTKEVKFVSFATPTVVGEIKRFFRDKGSVIRVPRRIYEVYQKVNSAKENLTQKLQRAPKVDEISEYLNIGSEQVLEIIESWNAYNMQSFDQNVFDNDDLELHETIGSDDNTFERIENRDFIEKSLNKFNEGEREFIKMRYFGSSTQKQIAEKFGVSQMYISRLERKILERFRSILSR
ncbi:MAG: SigB/SigF/SigG family RNA polymerase sigma factor [Clostridiales bacterium]